MCISVNSGTGNGHIMQTLVQQHMEFFCMKRTVHQNGYQKSKTIESHFHHCDLFLSFFIRTHRSDTRSDKKYFLHMFPNSFKDTRCPIKKNTRCAHSRYIFSVEVLLICSSPIYLLMKSIWEGISIAIAWMPRPTVEIYLKRIDNICLGMGYLKKEHANPASTRHKIS